MEKTKKRQRSQDPESPKLSQKRVRKNDPSPKPAPKQNPQSQEENKTDSKVWKIHPSCRN